MGRMDRLLADLETRKAVVEVPFGSRLPVIGGVIAWFRTRWNDIATRWYVRPLLQQQNEVNALWLAALQEHIEESRSQLELLEQDQMAIVEQVAEMTHRLGCLEQRILVSARDRAFEAEDSSERDQRR